MNSPTILEEVTEPNSAVIKNAAAARPRRRQLQPGQRLVDSYKREYFVDQNGSLRRVEGGKPCKATKKALKRQRQAARRMAR